MIVPFRLKEGKFRFYDTRNQKGVFENQKYDFIFPFHNGFSVIKNDGKYGAVNENGNLSIPLIYDYISPISENHFLCSINQKYGVVGITGNLVIPPIYVNLSNVNNGLIRFSEKEDLYSDLHVSDDVEYGFVNLQNKVVIPPIFVGAKDFSENLAVVGSYFGLDEDYNSIIKFGYINTSGNIIIDCQFDYAESFNGGVALVRLRDAKYYINQKGERVGYLPQPTETPKIFSIKALVTTVLGDGESELFGFKDNDGRIVIKPKYDEVSKFENGLALVFLRNQSFYILPNGKELREEISDL